MNVNLLNVGENVWLNPERIESVVEVTGYGTRTHCKVTMDSGDTLTVETTAGSIFARIDALGEHLSKVAALEKEAQR